MQTDSNPFNVFFLISPPICHNSIWVADIHLNEIKLFLGTQTERDILRDMLFTS